MIAACDQIKTARHDALPGDQEHHRRHDIERLLHEHGQRRFLADHAAHEADGEREDPRDRDEMEEQAEVGEEEAEALRQQGAE